LGKVTTGGFFPPAIVIGRTSVTLTWTYWGTNEVSFNVRSLKTNQIAAPSMSWPIITNTAAHSLVIPIDKSATAVWFALTAVDSVTGLESDFAW